MSGSGPGSACRIGQGSGWRARRRAIGRRVLDRGADRPTRRSAGAQRLQAREGQHQLVAALAFGQRVDLVDDHPLEPREGARRVLVAEQQREAFRRRQQDMRRVGALRRRLAWSEVSPVRSSTRMGRPISLIGRHEVAADVGGQRLQRRDVEGVEPRRGASASLDQRGQEPGQRLAAAGGRDQQQRGRVRARQHVRLVRVDRPAAGGEPISKCGRQRRHAAHSRASLRIG